MMIFQEIRNVEETKKDSEALSVKIDIKIAFKEEIVEEEDVDVETKIDLSNDKKDYVKLSASELLRLRHLELEKLKEHISCASLSVISNPQRNVDKLINLLRHAIGNKVYHLVVEDSQKIATASFAEIFIDINPGYYICDYSEAGIEFGTYYMDYVSEDCCKALKNGIMKEDYQFGTSLFTTSEIASAETEDDDKKEKKPFEARKNVIHKDRKFKSASKYEEPLKKLLKDLKEAGAANVLTEKMKFGTDTMKQVSTIYFSVFKCLSKSPLMEPVLEGLAKSAHFININFFL
uniref:NOC3p domain-containing protein n=1 Tax=Parastrongyloides trichosuri TaxID=131310 RepID=A0A0N4ZWD8_PARTI